MPSAKPKSPTRLTMKALSPRGSRRLLVPEADSTDNSPDQRPPSAEQLNQIICGHQHQHRESEQRQIGKERGR